MVDIVLHKFVLTNLKNNLPLKQDWQNKRLKNIYHPIKKVVNHPSSITIKTNKDYLHDMMVASKVWIKAKHLKQNTGKIIT